LKREALAGVLGAAFGAAVLGGREGGEGDENRCGRGDVPGCCRPGSPSCSTPPGLLARSEWSSRWHQKAVRVCVCVHRLVSECDVVDVLRPSVPPSLPPTLTPQGCNFDLKEKKIEWIFW